MDGKERASVGALNGGYKQSFPRTWILSAQIDQDGGRIIPRDNGEGEPDTIDYPSTQLMKYIIK